MKDLLFKNKNNADDVSVIPLTVSPIVTLPHALRAEPTELERSRVSEEHLFITNGTDTTTVGFKGLTAGDIIIF